MLIKIVTKGHFIVGLILVLVHCINLFNEYINVVFCQTLFHEHIDVGFFLNYIFNVNYYGKLTNKVMV